MAVTNFQQTVWSKKIQTQLDTITSLKNHCDYEFEPDSKNAKEVKILNVVRPTVRDYVKGTSLTRDAGTDGSELLKLDQMKYYNIEVEDVDKAQSVPGLIENLTKEANAGLSEEGDKYVASLMLAEANDASSSVGKATSTDISAATDGGVSLLEGAFNQLYKNNCKVNDNYYIEICPDFYTVLRPAIIKLDTDNSDLIKKGFVGKYGNGLISIENLLATYNDGTRDTKLCCVRTSKAIAFAGQIDKVEAYRPQDGFQDALKALYVFGAKVIRPEQMYLIPIY